MKKKFPATLYITRENERTGDEYLQPREEINDAAEIGTERRVAVYELKEVVVLTTQITAQPAGSGKRR